MFDNVMAVLIGLAAMGVFYGTGWLLARDVRKRHQGWLDKVTGERVLVHTVDNQTIEGALISVLRDGLVLRAPRLIDDQPVNVAGDVFIPRSKVALVQRIGESR